ncbi:hypothetical protein ANO11243_052060 [Dothideomycetidae sp. 11243]|nr:hypothetical protein ANO11243_052060 [fungal sp. No.11243]
MFKAAGIFLPLPWLTDLFTLQSKVARIGSLTFLIGDTTTIEPLHPKVLQVILKRLPVLFADTDADFRSDLLGLIQRMVDRIRASSAALFRKRDNRLQVTELFLHHWVKVLKNDLRPSASYQRHACALHCVMMLLRSGIDPSINSEFWSKSARSQRQMGFQIPLFDSSLFAVLLALLLDPFDDVRDLSMTILQAIVVSQPNNNSQVETLISFVQQAEQQSAKTGRADHSDGVGRACALMFSAAPDSPRYILESSAKFADKSESGGSSAILLGRIFRAVDSTWLAVRQVLCNDAPEGFVPDELEDDEAIMDSKSILSFCWRALKEAR